jgi:hypothetical protein
LTEPFRDLPQYTNPAELNPNGMDFLRIQWYEVVNVYSWRSLTFAKDRLPAFAAVAQQMQDLQPNNEYLAGLWRDTVLFDLTWEFEYNGEYHELFGSAEDVCIPSWSWARIYGNIYGGKQCKTTLSSEKLRYLTYSIESPM